MPLQDAETTRMVRREITRRHLDDSGLQVNAMHGVVYMRGELRFFPGQDCDLHAELGILHKIIRSRPGIRDVVMEISFDGKPVKLIDNKTARQAASSRVS